MSGEFASAAMVRVLSQGMRELGIPLPPLALAADAQDQATVDLDLKQALVGHAMAQAGLTCLVSLGRGLHRYAHEPTHRAMTTAGSPLELFERWRRLERYIHSSHRIAVRPLGDAGAVLVHEGLRPQAPPTLPESLVVVGVLAALLEALGVRQLQVQVGRRRIYPEPEEASLRRLAWQDPGREWQFRWEPAGAPGAGRREAPPALADLLPADAPEWVHALVAHLMEDPMRLPSVAEAAARLGRAPRTLQRALKDLGLSFTGLVAQTRTRHAAWYLIESDLSLAEIGFLCGYADQPHFTRDFGRRVGLSPDRYRQSFWRPARSRDR